MSMATAVLYPCGNGSFAVKNEHNQVIIPCKERIKNTIGVVTAL